MNASGETLTPVEDERDRHFAQSGTGALRELNRAGLLTAADVHVASRLGVLGGEADEWVLTAVARAVAAVRAGSVCLAVDALADGLTTLAADGLVTLPGSGADLATRLAASPLTGAVLRLDGGNLYLDRYWQEESLVVDVLGSRTGPPDDEGWSEADLAAALDTYFPDDKYADQRAAAETACRHRTAVVTGGPGTGKTTTVARLLGVLLALQPEGRSLRIALAAPTGKAAARMAQAVRAATEQPRFPGAGLDPAARAGDPAYERREVVRNLDSSTLHRLLGSRPDSRTRFRHHRANPLPHDVVVVDETSMVSLTMMARLLEAVRRGARLVLVGDADQLASVEAGAVLRDLVDGWDPAGESGRSRAGGPVSRLVTARRYDEHIGALADAIRDDRPDDVVGLLARGGPSVEWSEADVLAPLLGRHARALHDAALAGDRPALLAQLSRHRLLCAHREGPYGVAHWNREIERLLMSATGRDWLPEWYAGRPFVVNSNDPGLGLYNGDTGVVLRDDDRLVGLVDDGLEPGGRLLPTTRLADVSTAHAMTVHRSQGSQFAEVTVLLPEGGSRILTRELLYTAVTRAEERVRVVGSEEAVRAAMATTASRATGLAARLAPPG